MVNIGYVAITAIIVFVIYLMAAKIIIFILLKISSLINKKVSLLGYNVVESIALYLMFFIIWLFTIDVVDKRLGLSDLDFYMAYCVMGLSSVIWSYFEWSIYSIKSKIKWSREKNLKIKRAIVFLAVLVFTLYYGYQKVLHNIYGDPIEPALLIAETTMITTAIAFDRILNQMYKAPNDENLTSH